MSMTGVSRELVVGVPGPERRDGGVEGRGVAEAGVLVAGGERAGHAARASPTAVAGRAARCPPPRLLGPHHPGGVDLRPGDVAVHVDPAGHHDVAPRIDRPVGPDLRDRPGRRRPGRPRSRGRATSPSTPLAGSITCPPAIRSRLMTGGPRPGGSPGPATAGRCRCRPASGRAPRSPRACRSGPSPASRSGR